MFFFLLIGIGGYLIAVTKIQPSLRNLPASQTTLQASPIINSASPAPNGVGANWKTFTNKTYGFSFSYPPNFTIPEVPDYCGGCIGSILDGNDINNVLINFVVMRSGQGAYCMEGGGTIDLSLTPAPTEPLKIAESEARCGCEGDTTSGYQTCSKASNEKSIPATGDSPTGYQFYLQQNSYTYSKDRTVLTESKVIGPYQAYFFPKPITFQDTENIGIYFKLEKQDGLSLFNQILSTFKFLGKTGGIPEGIIGKQCFRPRTTPGKPTHTQLSSGVYRDRFTIKFAEGSGIRLRDGKLVSLTGTDLTKLNTVLRQYAIRIERTVSQPEEKVEKDKARIEAKSGDCLADMNLYYRILISSEQDIKDIERFIDQLNALPIVEIAYPDSLPMPPPGNN